ncbi:hypothetical protein DEJ50_32795 [Streptomyces venezuelae]|uniref:DmpG-like communication domain-containing protein n=1 Tax=Streptomyces venezuelae TaxID=54571 RepID=A0A5P2D9R8_STRVZ|nr:hypothetical protein [Streptomyces venezuelae]QES51912.1 hypothetical protein DEJ50_32795 [Streptomyces venezuelae]
MKRGSRDLFHELGRRRIIAGQEDAISEAARSLKAEEARR